MTRSEPTTGRDDRGLPTESADPYVGRAPLDVSADLTVTVEGQPISVESYTDVVRVDLPSLRLLLALSRVERRRTHIYRLDRLLRTVDLTLDLAVDGTRIARLGADTSPTVPPLSRFQLDARGAMRALYEAPLRFFS